LSIRADSTIGSSISGGKFDFSAEAGPKLEGSGPANKFQNRNRATIWPTRSG
jgi:hypothetical protein